MIVSDQGQYALQQHHLLKIFLGIVPAFRLLLTDLTEGYCQKRAEDGSYRGLGTDNWISVCPALLKIRSPNSSPKYGLRSLI